MILLILHGGSHTRLIVVINYVMMIHGLCADDYLLLHEYVMSHSGVPHLFGICAMINNLPLHTSSSGICISMILVAHKYT